MAESISHIVAIGGGQAGASLVARLRARGYDGAITLLCAEPVPPYQRPPLSKAYLKGEMEQARLYLRPAGFYAEKDIALRTGTRATALDTDARQVTLEGGEVLSYDALVLATGARARLLPASCGGDLGGVFPVRSLADVDALAGAFAPGARALIVGGGYIGLEAAAVAAQTGLEVTVIEMGARILRRTSSAETSAWFRDLHARHGVAIREGVGLNRLTGSDTDSDSGRVTGARLTDGSEIALDLAILGMGIVPDTALAEAAGLGVDNGIRVDARGRTSAPGVWAAGDCTSFPWRGGRIRLESVQNAIDQAECVADNILGAGRDYAPLPWFWSDQYDVKLQIAGLGAGHDRVVTRGNSHWYFAGDRLLAVDAMNDPRAYMIGKRLLEAGRSPDPDALADPETDLKALLRP